LINVDDPEEHGAGQYEGLCFCAQKWCVLNPKYGARLYESGPFFLVGMISGAGRCHLAVLLFGAPERLGGQTGRVILNGVYAPALSSPCP